MLHRHQLCVRVQVAPHSLKCGGVSLFNISHPGGCRLAPRGVLIGAALLTNGAQRSLTCSLVISVFLSEKSAREFCPFYSWVVLKILSSRHSSHVLGMSSHLLRHMFCKYFHPVRVLPVLFLFSGLTFDEKF